CALKVVVRRRYVSYYHDEYLLSLSFFFFFQAEDGIRDKLVTGVQTCALPISMRSRDSIVSCERMASSGRSPRGSASASAVFDCRSEERRVGKECRSRWWADDYKKKEASRNMVISAVLDIVIDYSVTEVWVKLG